MCSLVMSVFPHDFLMDYLKPSYFNNVLILASLESALQNAKVNNNRHTFVYMICKVL